jgi:hypothetical protein
MRGPIMRCKLICSIALALAILIQPTSSKTTSVVSGLGSSTCAEIAETYRLTPRMAENMMMYWAQGFMSGANSVRFVRDGEYVDLSGMTIEAQEASLRNYCDEHPMVEFFQATMDLYGKLPMKKVNLPASR